MTQKNLPKAPTLENVSTKLRSARKIAPNTPIVILDFADYMADIAIKKSKYHCKFTAETLWILTFDAKDHIEAEGDVDIPVPAKLKGKMPEILKNMKHFYLLIDKISSKKFSEKFKKLNLLANVK